MVHGCCVPNCKKSYKKGKVTLHCFPKDPERRKTWESKIKRPNFKAKTYSKVCSRHFKPECFESGKFGGTWLTKKAVPTIFDSDDEPSAKSQDDNKSAKPAVTAAPTMTVVPKSSSKLLAVAVVQKGSARVRVMPQSSSRVLAVSVTPNSNGELPAIDVVPQFNRRVVAMAVVPKSNPPVAEVPKSPDVSKPSEIEHSEKRMKPAEDISLTSTTEPPSFEFKKRLCYTGDFDEDTVVAQFPENARKFYHLAKSEIVSKNKEIRSLRKEHKRLKKRVANLIKMLYEFRERHIIIGDVSSI